MLPSRMIPIGSNLQIAIHEDGDPDGIPVFFFHGWPGSRLQGAGFGPAARELGVRLISPDRPGIGGSTFQGQRTLLDWPPIVKEIAHQLGLSRYRILAMSGGAPYAFATAYSLPESVEALGIISGAPPLTPLANPKDVLFAYRFLIGIYRFRPDLLRWTFKTIHPVATWRPPRWLWPLMLRLVPEADRAALSDPAVFEGSLECYHEAWSGHSLGVITDAEVYAFQWGFPVEPIQIPVRLWHGKADLCFHWKFVEAFTRRLADCRSRFLDQEGHYSLAIRYKKEILRDLIEAPLLLQSPAQVP
jgi:pimeloyl-ACP methyl ester carboxylesterase